MMPLPTGLEAPSPIRVYEYCAVLLAIVIAFAMPSRYESPFEVLEGSFKKLARRPALSLLPIPAAPVLLRLACPPFARGPQPGVHHDSGNSLSADTFGQGRVAN